MPLGPLPYKAKVAQAQTDPAQGMQLVISILDGGSGVRNQFNYDFSQRSFADARDMQTLLMVMFAAVAQQFISDAPDLPTALDSISVSLGG